MVNFTFVIYANMYGRWKPKEATQLSMEKPPLPSPFTQTVPRKEPTQVLPYLLFLRLLAHQKVCTVLFSTDNFKSYEIIRDIRVFMLDSTVPILYTRPHVHLELHLV